APCVTKNLLYAILRLCDNEPSAYASVDPGVSMPARGEDYRLPHSPMRPAARCSPRVKLPSTGPCALRCRDDTSSRSRCGLALSGLAMRQAGRRATVGWCPASTLTLSSATLGPPTWLQPLNSTTGRTRFPTVYAAIVLWTVPSAMPAFRSS